MNVGQNSLWTALHPPFCLYLSRLSCFISFTRPFFSSPLVCVFLCTLVCPLPSHFALAFLTPFICLLLFSSLTAYHSLFLHPTFFFFFFSFCYPVHLHSPALAAVFDSSLTFFLNLKDLPLSLSTHHTTVFTLRLGDTCTQHPHIYFSLKSSSLFVEIAQSPNNRSM